MFSNVTNWLTNTARLYPSKTALVDESSSITYQEYYAKSIDIASRIIETKIGIRKPIVVYLEKSIKVPVSFMGVAYSGNFYSPIDVEMPSSRVNKILETLKPQLVITTKELQESFAQFDYDGQYLIYDENAKDIDEKSILDLSDSMIDIDLLYVLFTSGSTGIPKGVCITHRAVLDFIDWVDDTFHIEETNRFGNQAPFYFDNSIFDIYTCMKKGATLYIIPKKLFAQPVRLLEYINENKIDVIFWVPSALIIVAKLRALKSVDVSKTLKKILFAGEVMPTKQLNIWKQYVPNAQYVNMYGPTEITDICTYYIIDREFFDEEALPIGKATKNMEVLVLDNDNKLIVEPNKVGELCVRGTGVASGYYANEEKTKSAFVQNPMNNYCHDIIYRTGDLVEYNDRGEIMYLSRKDFQIKHMGHRIELGEIETAASSLKDVTSCCCLYDEKNEKIVLFIDKDIKREEVISELKALLPEYMLPNRVIYIENFELNANGKIDRLKLKEKI